MKVDLPTNVTIKGYPTHDGVIIEESLSDMKLSLAEYKVNAVDDMIIKTMSDDNLLNLFTRVSKEKLKRGL